MPLTYTADNFTNFATSTIAGGAGGTGSVLNSGDTSLILATGTGSLFPSTFPFALVINPLGSSPEIVKCTARSVDTLTITRAQESTSAATWPVGTTVSHDITAANMTNLWGRVSDISKSLQFYNVLNYGIVGDGSTNNGSALRTLFTTINTAGVPAVVYFPAGTYMTDVALGTAAGYYVAFQIPPNVTVEGDGQNVSIVKFVANIGHPGTDVAMVRNWNIATGDDNITIRDITFDGNSLNQSGLTSGQTHSGVAFLRAQNVHCQRVTSQYFYGLDSGTNENFHFEFGLSTNGYFTECLVLGNAKTGSGFSADGATNVFYTHCTAHGVQGNGFTHNGSANLFYENCHSYLNGSDGFNSEVAENVRYTNCIAGGRSVNASAYPYGTAQTSLGNTSYGFCCNQSSPYALIGCTATYNSGSGFAIAGLTSSQIAEIIGGDYSNNGAPSGALSSTPGCAIRIKGPIRITGNTNSNLNSTEIGWVGAPVAGGYSQAYFAMPASGTYVSNPVLVDSWLQVIANGATISSINIRDPFNTGQTTTIGTAAGYYFVPSGVQIAISYSGGTPQWNWNTMGY